MTDIATLKGKTEVAPIKPKDQVKALLEKNKLAIAQALPKHMNAERLMRVALTAITTTPALLECYVPTLLGGIIQCSQMGLEPNTVMGHAYLVPFFNSKKNRKDAQVIVGYRGLIDLARRSGQITSIAAHAVRKNDLFVYEYGLHEDLKHIPSEGERGDITHFYAIAHMKDGGHAFEIMTRGQVEKIRDSGNKNPVWKEHFEEMGRKTVIRRLAKYLPLSVEFATSIAQDGQAAPALEGDGSLTAEFSTIEEEGEDADDERTGGGETAKGMAGAATSQGATVGTESVVAGDAKPAETLAASKMAQPETPTADAIVEKIRSIKSLEALDTYIDQFNGSAHSDADRARIQTAYVGRREVLEANPDRPTKARAETME